MNVLYTVLRHVSMVVIGALVCVVPAVLMLGLVYILTVWTIPTLLALAVLSLYGIGYCIFEHIEENS